MSRNAIADRTTLILTGLLGLMGAILTGSGEFLLHFDPAARFGEGLQFFKGVSESRATLGHFIGVLAAPLYLAGAFHLYLMLRPAHPSWALILLTIMVYSLIIAFIWLGSRASLDALAELPLEPSASHLIHLHELRYESLLDVARVGMLIVSVIFVGLIVTGRSAYPRWFALFNPAVLIIACFGLWLGMPTAGKFVMPIALNVAFAIIFAISLSLSLRSSLSESATRRGAR